MFDHKVLLFLLIKIANGNIVSDDKDKLFHGFPGFLLSIPEEEKDVIKLSMKVDDKMNCAFACAAQHWCRSVLFKVDGEDDGKHFCGLLSADKFTHQKYIIKNDNFTLLTLKNPCESNPCLNGGICIYLGDNDFNCKDGDIRLAGQNFTHGRVEVFLDGQWGTVCDDGWDMNDGHVACRQLGFKRAIQVYYSAHFGKGNSTILMDDMACTGTEKKLQDCKRKTEKHNCSHSEDASVACEANEV